MAAAKPSVSDPAVRRATGRGWSAWFAALDRFGAAKGHAAMARHLAARHGLSPWWSQTVVVEFERARGLRRVHERADGRFQVGVQRTVEAPVRTAFAGWADAKAVGTWFTTKARQDVRVGGTYRNADGDRGTYLAVAPPRRLRFTWDNPTHAPGTVVEVTFSARGSRRTVVRLRHDRLATKADADGMKTGWTWALTSFARWVETGQGLPYEVWARERAKRRGPSPRALPRGGRRPGSSRAPASAPPPPARARARALPALLNGTCTRFRAPSGSTQDS